MIVPNKSTAETNHNFYLVPNVCGVGRCYYIIGKYSTIIIPDNPCDRVAECYGERSMLIRVILSNPSEQAAVYLNNPLH